MKIQISKAWVRKFCLLPSTLNIRPLIRVARVFSLNCMIPAPIFWSNAARSLIESSAMATFLSQDCCEATELIKKRYWQSLLHTHNWMRMMSKLPVIRFSYGRYQWMLSWWGWEGKRIQPFIHWFADQRQKVTWLTWGCFWWGEFFRCWGGPRWCYCIDQWYRGWIQGGICWFFWVRWYSCS